MKFSVSNLRRYPAPIRLVVFILILLVLWLPIALPIYTLVHDRNLATILTLAAFYLEFLWLVQRWGKQVHQQPQILQHYGLEFSQRIGRELLFGLGIGVASVLVLYGAQLILGWLTLNEPSFELRRVALEGLLVALGIGFAEELLFRGWLLDELQRDYSLSIALWANAVIFAALHVRLSTFPAYVLLGATLVWAKRSFSSEVPNLNNLYAGEAQNLSQGRSRYRLGLPIGLHAGMVWGNYVIEVSKLVEPSNRVPVWVTGLDRNPLAGIMGLLFLAALAMSMRQLRKISAKAREESL